MGKTRTDTVERFLSRVVKTPGCWLWEGCVNSSGYGKLFVPGKRAGSGHVVSVHRYAYVLFCGPIPAGIRVLHHCEEKICVRPDHLYLGIHRPRPYAINSQAKLTEELVERIRIYLAGGVNSDLLAAKYAVSRSTINRIRRGDSWRPHGYRIHKIENI